MHAWHRVISPRVWVWGVGGGQLGSRCQGSPHGAGGGQSRGRRKGQRLGRVPKPLLSRLRGQPGGDRTGAPCAVTARWLEGGSGHRPLPVVVRSLGTRGVRGDPGHLAPWGPCPTPGGGLSCCQSGRPLPAEVSVALEGTWPEGWPPRWTHLSRPSPEIRKEPGQEDRLVSAGEGGRGGAPAPTSSVLLQARAPPDPLVTSGRPAAPWLSSSGARWPAASGPGTREALALRVLARWWPLGQEGGQCGELSAP